MPHSSSPNTTPVQATQVTSFQLESKVVSKPNAALQVTIVTIPQVIKEGIAAALAKGAQASGPPSNK
jgi:hypothetical protein